MTNSLKLRTSEDGIVEFLTFQYIRESIDKEPNIHLFSTMHKQAWSLQLRALVPLKTPRNYNSQLPPKNYIATARLDRAEMEALRNMIDEHLMESVEFPTQPAMVDAIRKATPELLEDLKEGGIAVPITVTPGSLEDAEKVFKVLSRAGIGAIWMGKTREFIVQSFQPFYTTGFLNAEFKDEKIKAKTSYSL